ncbi:UBX domain-containing protein, putative isoform 2 [Hibiscus syriacus]|uniref:UBX domain-containing protein, putative isoform 2 n=1 Tax=Hibiscus syriacus TaxID=106335 RepID=A0A6A2X7F5_HIBSY|nr:UBX domain-containing protein, putative isoform 2 [Hibiscus syriacus]
MSTPTWDAIESFKSITGQSESVALRKLEEYGGDLNVAVSAYFLELERSVYGSVPSMNPIKADSSRHDSVDVNNQSGFGARGIVPLISAVRRFRPSLLLDPNYRRNLLNQIGAPNFNHQATSPHMGEVTGVPVVFSSGNEHPLYSGVRPSSITDSLGTPLYYGGGIYNNVSRDGHQQINGVESEMMQAAIEASKEFEQTYMNQRHGSSNGSSSVGLQQRHLEQEDDELARAISLSLKTADEEKAIRMLKDHYEQMGAYDSNDRTKATTSNNSKKNLFLVNKKCAEFKAGNSSVIQPPVTHEPIHDIHNHLRSRDSLNSNEWVGISEKELDEAIMLETQHFSQITEGWLCLPSHEQGGPSRSINDGLQAVSQPQSSSLVDQRLLRKQQDEEYLISLLADKEKEMDTLKKAESHSLKEESFRRKLEGGDFFKTFDTCDDDEVYKVVATKMTSLPPEPARDDENAVTILVRMPDGTRHGHCFCRSDKLQVRPYPRRAFGAADCSLSLNQLGLTSKKEALFLEFI